MKFKIVNGLAHVDEEHYPGLKLFDDALNEAVKEFYIPLQTTFRVTRVEGNMLFTVLCELCDAPGFVGLDK